MRNIMEKFHQIKDEVGRLKHILDGIDMNQIINLTQEIERLKAERKYLKEDISELKEVKAITASMNNSKFIFPATENDSFKKCEYSVLLNESETIVKLKKNGMVRTFALIKFDFDYDFDAMGV